MRREDIRLLARARQGDPHARCELGRRYLLGVDGFARNVTMGVEHLRHPSVADLPPAACLLAENLPLHELVALDLLDVLARAAGAGSAVAQARLGLWLSLKPGATGGRHWLRQAAESGHAGARQALAVLDAHAGSRHDARHDTPRMQGLVQALHACGEIDGAAVALLAARQALQAQDLPALQAALAAVLALPGSSAGDDPATRLDPALVTLVAATVHLAETAGGMLTGLPPAVLRQALEARANQGDRDAAYALGRALCGIGSAGLAPAVFAEHQNLRKGAAFLLRAADAGIDDAWLHLYRLYADNRSSVANLQMARFFLEKAALGGSAEAQRKLGALVLREAATLQDSEQAIHWLWLAADQGDAHAHRLLESLVLPVDGNEADAASALEQVRAADPWLAARLTLARHFGLTKLEALAVDPAEGLRPWGLVVGRNPLIVKSRLAAPRAIPALDDAALRAARHAAALFGQAGSEGDMRSRSMRQRRLLERMGIADSLFFSDARSTTLESLRLGAKWAWRARQPLQAALAT
ncbi:hypothetical protein [Pseudorhodoferax sp.]|uniref:hypothetical protein n=1 Tax=Pseudorhodoferax sp. TaxID=1993553 RepID=UPI002DD64A17|nr:hypothetical protein [Pseudorhodoferax sp.]